MTFTAEVRIEHPEFALSRALEAAPDVRAEREYQMGGDADDRYAFFSVYGASFDEFEAALDSDPTVAGSLLVAAFDDRRLYRIELAEAATMLASKLASLGVAVVEASGSGGQWRLVLRVPDRDRLAAFNAYCDERGVDMQVERLSRSTDDAESRARPPLTDAQREALIAASKKGYFEEPRRTSLEELASELDVSSTAVGGRIRRGTAALVDAMLLSDETE